MKSEIQSLVEQLEATNVTFNKFIDRYDKRDNEFRKFVRNTYSKMDNIENNSIEIKTDVKTLNNKVFWVISSLIGLIGAGIFGLKEKVVSLFFKS